MAKGEARFALSERVRTIRDAQARKGVLNAAPVGQEEPAEGAHLDHACVYIHY